MRGFNRITTWIKGLTFLEVLLALSIFAVIFVGISQRAIVALDTCRRINIEAIATNLRGALMSQVMAKNFTSVDGYNGNFSSPPRTVGGLSMNGTGGMPNYTGFSCSVTVINGTVGGTGCDAFNVSPTNLPLSDCKEVIVNVTSPDGKTYLKYEYKTINAT